jgi:hypothetical protein
MLNRNSTDQKPEIDIESIKSKRLKVIKEHQTVKK